jgi:hypothetical protein
MERIPIKAWNRIEMLRQPIAAEILSGDKQRRWKAIYCTGSNSTSDSPTPHHYFLLDAEFDAAGLAEQEPYGDEDLAITHQVRYYVSSEDELYPLVLKLNADPQLFDTQWHVDYPLLA